MFMAFLFFQVWHAGRFSKKLLQVQVFLCDLGSESSQWVQGHGL